MLKEKVLMLCERSSDWMRLRNVMGFLRQTVGSVVALSGHGAWGSHRELPLSPKTRYLRRPTLALRSDDYRSVYHAWPSQRVRTPYFLAFSSACFAASRFFLAPSCLFSALASRSALNAWNSFSSSSIALGASGLYPLVTPGISRVRCAVKSSPYIHQLGPVMRKSLTVASPRLGLPTLRGKTTRRVRYSLRRSMFTFCPSSDLLLLRWSTVMPSPLASFLLIPASFSSVRVKPRPSSSRQLKFPRPWKRVPTPDADIVSLSRATDSGTEAFEGGSTGSESLL